MNFATSQWCGLRTLASAIWTLTAATQQYPTVFPCPGDPVVLSLSHISHRGDRIVGEDGGKLSSGCKISNKN